jgi:hypothetical protein
LLLNFPACQAGSCKVRYLQNITTCTFLQYPCYDPIPSFEIVLLSQFWHTIKLSCTRLLPLVPFLVSFGNMGIGLHNTDIELRFPLTTVEKLKTLDVQELILTLEIREGYSSSNFSIYKSTMRTSLLPRRGLLNLSSYPAESQPFDPLCPTTPRQLLLLERPQLFQRTMAY